VGAKEIDVGHGAEMERIAVIGDAPHETLLMQVDVVLYRLEKSYTKALSAMLDDVTFTRWAPPGVPATLLGWSDGLQNEAETTDLAFLNVGPCPGGETGEAKLCAAHSSADPRLCGDGAFGAPLLIRPRDEYWADVVIGISSSPIDCNPSPDATVQLVSVFDTRRWINETLESWKAEAGPTAAGDYNLRVLVEDRIVAGKEVSPENKYPYSVSLSQFNDAFCGGSLIHPRVVLTAAHCAKSMLSNFRIKVSK
jgi:hypothetical protein